jgi:hypothetical protein
MRKSIGAWLTVARSGEPDKFLSSPNLFLRLWLRRRLGPMRRHHIAKTPIALTSCAPKSNSESDRTAVSSFQESAGPRQVQFPNQHMTALQTALFKSGCFLTLFFVAGFSLTACQAKPQEEVAQPVVMPTPTGMIDEPTKALPADVF